MFDHRITTVTKQIWQVVLGLLIDGDAKRFDAQPMRLEDGLMGIFNAKTALVMINIIGFAIG